MTLLAHSNRFYSSWLLAAKCHWSSCTATCMNLCCVSIYCTCITLYLCTTHVPVPLYLYPSTCTPVPVPLYPLYPLYCTPCACVVFQKIGNVFFSLIYKLKKQYTFFGKQHKHRGYSGLGTGTGACTHVQVQVHVPEVHWTHVGTTMLVHSFCSPLCNAHGFT